MEVDITDAAAEEIAKLPRPIQVRVYAAVESLQDWPNVSGCKVMRKEWKGCFRKRTGDYRVVFHVDVKTEVITIVKVGNRKDVYE